MGKARRPKRRKPSCGKGRFKNKIDRISSLVIAIYPNTQPNDLIEISTILYDHSENSIIELERQYNPPPADDQWWEWMSDD